MVVYNTKDRVITLSLLRYLWGVRDGISTREVATRFFSDNDEVAGTERADRLLSKLFHGELLNRIENKWVSTVQPASPDPVHLSEEPIDHRSHQIAQRLKDRAPVKTAVRLIPEAFFEGRLGPRHRLYTCVGDFEELRNLSVREAVRCVYGLTEKEYPWDSGPGRCFNRSVGTYHVPYLDGEPAFSDSFYVVKLDLEHWPAETDAFPGTWNSIAYILCDCERMAARPDVFFRFREIRNGIDPFFGLPKEHIELTQNGGACYGYITLDSLFGDVLVGLFGTHNRCWRGGGYVGEGGLYLSRVFLVRNLGIDTLPVISCRLMHADEILT